MEFPHFPQAAANTISGQIKDRLFRERIAPTGVTPMALAPRVALHESIDIYDVDTRSVNESTNSLLGLAKQTNRWHHQIKLEGAPVGFATSRKSNESDAFQLATIAHSALAAKIDTEIAWLDSLNAPGLVSLLVIPSVHVYAFWIRDSKTNKEWVSMIDGAARIGLQHRQLYSIPAFAGALSRSLVIEGLIE